MACESASSADSWGSRLGCPRAGGSGATPARSLQGAENEQLAVGHDGFVAEEEHEVEVESRDRGALAERHVVEAPEPLLPDRAPDLPDPEQENRKQQRVPPSDHHPEKDQGTESPH